MDEFIPNSAERAKAMRDAAKADHRVKQLIQACKNANKGAIVPAESPFKYPYSIDHIVPRSQGGGDFYINLWLCPMEWNTLNGIMERGPHTIKAILAWIELHGRICQVMPISILLAEQQDLIDGIIDGRFPEVHWTYERIMRLGLGR